MHVSLHHACGALNLITKIYLLDLERGNRYGRTIVPGYKRTKLACIQTSFPDNLLSRNYLNVILQFILAVSRNIR
jgi:hypothetical protein